MKERNKRCRYPKWVLRWALPFLRDNCQVCHGVKGGQWGNENRIAGKVVCDYCTASYLWG